MAFNEGYHEYTLPNGLVVALQYTPTKTVAAKLRVNYGAVHERAGEEGMAHFLEHCLVTGGSRKYSPQEVDKIRDKFGYSNAHTGIGRTCFVGKMLPKHFETWIEYVSEHALHPRFDEERVNAERERVLREISDSKSNPSYSLDRKIDAALYREHPKGIMVLGRENVVADASLNKIREYHSRGFNPNNMDLIIAGNIPINAEAIIERYFTGEQGANTRCSFPLLETLASRTILRESAPDILNRERPSESSAPLVLNFICPPDKHPDEYAVSTMSMILGGGINSKLFQAVSLKKGLAYHINSSYNGNYNAGHLTIHAQVHAPRIDQAVDSIFEEMDKMKHVKVDEDELERVKEAAIFEIVSTFEENAGHVSAIEKKIDEGLTPERFIEGYNRVTPSAIVDVANKYLPSRDQENYVLAIRDPLLK